MIRPRNGFVVIRRDGRTLKTDAASKIILPDSARGSFDSAIVVAVGPGSPADSYSPALDDEVRRMSDTADLRPGQRVLLLSGTKSSRRSPLSPAMVTETAPTTLPFEVDGQAVELIPQHLILAILEDAGEEKING